TASSSINRTAPCLYQLYRGHAYTAGTTVHQKRFAFANVLTVEYVGPNCEISFGQRSCLYHREIFGNGKTLYFGNCHVLGVTTTREKGTHFVARFKTFAILCFGHNTGNLQPWNVL